MRVLVVRHHEEDAPGLVGEAFAALGATVETLLYPNEGALPGSSDADHVVFLGAHTSVYRLTPWIEAELEWLRRAPVPVLGICFGAQLLAAARTGAVEKSPIYELGWVDVEPLAGAGEVGVEPGPWFQFHGDRCVLPPNARLLARNDVGVQAYTIGRDLAVQFHPELDTAQLERWMDNGGRITALMKGKDPDELLERTAREEPHARRRAATLVGTYLAHVARHHVLAETGGS